MNQSNKYIDSFLALVRYGLWEADGKLSGFGEVNYAEILRLAEGQSVVGLITAGLEHVADVNVPKEELLQFIGQSIQIEQRNNSMNEFIGVIVDKMRKSNIYIILVKGQGVAQCYERPQWRSSGDVDFLLSDGNYDKAREFLLPLSSRNKPNERYSRHLGMSIDPWYVEIHGTLRTGLSGRVDKVVDEVQKDVFYGGNVRSWNNGNKQVFLPAPDNDVFFVFTHFIKHFYKEGMNLRQICDWCRLLWTFREKINRELLKKRLEKSGLMKEWKGFATFAVDYLGMPFEAMPLYDSISKKDKARGKQLMEFILCGYSGSKLKNTISITKIFPWETLRYSPSIFLNVNWMKIKERIFKR